VSATILRDQHPPSKAATRPHDPDVCGLGFDSDCDACRAVRLHAERDFLGRDADARERVRLRTTTEHFAETTGIPLADLAAAILPYLAEPMAEIVCAVLDEREVTA
jgi:hypothetical protein